MKKKKTAFKTIHFVSLGCPKNRVDTEVMAGIAIERGLKIVADPQDADLIVVDTCAFIEIAREESVNMLFQMAQYRQTGRCKALVCAGCLSQRYAKALAEDMPELDFLLGTKNPDEIAQIIEGEASKVQVGQAGHFLQTTQTPRFLEPCSSSAYVKIADGCSRKCAFCAIPGIRGTARSRPSHEIVEEAHHLAKSGIKELNLVAQDTSAYGRDLKDGTNLAKLVRALDNVDGIKWVRLLYLYPDAVTDELLKAIAQCKKAVPYLDIPIQHAGSNMLQIMRRGHDPDKLRKMIERIRKILPNVFLRTTVLVGHPGETDEDIDQLLEFLEFARFDHFGAFRYSAEEGTAAAEMIQNVKPRQSYNRWRKVMAAGRRISQQNHRKRKGEILQVLIEDVADEQGFVMSGRHLGQAPDVDGETFISSCEASPGEIINAKVVKSGGHDLIVEPAANQNPIT